MLFLVRTECHAKLHSKMWRFNVRLAFRIGRGNSKYLAGDCITNILSTLAYYVLFYLIVPYIKLRYSQNNIKLVLIRELLTFKATLNWMIFERSLAHKRTPSVPAG